MRSGQAAVPQIFAHEQFGKMRVVIIDGEPWFVGIDVANALGYSDPFGALKKHVDDEDKTLCQIDSGSRGLQNTTVINESGVYSLIIRSNLPKARDFKRWLTKEVLPSLRKYGYYAMPGQICDGIEEFGQLEDSFLKMMKLCDRYSVLTEKLQQTERELTELQFKKRKLIENRNSLRKELEELRIEVEAAATEFLKPVRRKIFVFRN